MKTKLSMIGMAAALVLLAAPVSRATLLIQDTFDTSNTGMNDDLGDRQTGSLATTTWNLNSEEGDARSAVISNNELVVRAAGGFSSGPTALVSLNHDFTDAAITTGSGFSVSFDMKRPSTSQLGFGLGLTEADRKSTEGLHDYAYNRPSTDWGFHESGSIYVDGSVVATFTQPAQNTWVNYRVDVTTANFNSGTTAAVAFYIDDVLIDEGREFTWDGNGTNYLALSAMRGNNPDMVIDNFSVSVIPSEAPTAHAQSVTVEPNTPKAITLTGSDPDNDPLTFEIVTQPTYGTLTGTAPEVTYTPPASPEPGVYPVTVRFTPTDTANYNTVDGSVDVTVIEPNTPPVADAQSVTTTANMPLDITLSGGDADADPLTYAVVTGPASGTLSGTAPNLTYTPNADYTGDDSFTFKVNDGTEDSTSATVSITVLSADALY
jgi:hypothetical protein